MEGDGVQRDGVSYNSALDALSRGGRWEEAMALLQQMTTATPPVAADLRACNTFLRGASTCRTGSPCAA